MTDGAIARRLMRGNTGHTARDFMRLQQTHAFAGSAWVVHEVSNILEPDSTTPRKAKYARPKVLDTYHGGSCSPHVHLAAPAGNKLTFFSSNKTLSNIAMPLSAASIEADAAHVSGLLLLPLPLMIDHVCIA